MVPVGKYSLNEQINKPDLEEQILINHRLYKPFVQTPGQTLSYTKNSFTEKFEAKTNLTLSGNTAINCVISEN